jgi:hypothetical protein
MQTISMAERKDDLVKTESDDIESKGDGGSSGGLDVHSDPFAL